MGISFGFPLYPYGIDVFDNECPDIVFIIACVPKIAAGIVPAAIF